MSGVEGENVVMVSGARGRGDDDATRVLQRAVPPAEALAWLTAAAGARSVDAVEPMPGGASLAMHRVTVSFADGDRARLVLRRSAYFAVYRARRRSMEKRRSVRTTRAPQMGLLSAG
jgi:hypothetical protein